MATKKPLILVSNDDGITAPGLRNLIKVANQLGEVVVVAPDGPQSGKGHAITIDGILRCDEITIDDGPQKEYSCSGTPVDCVKLAVNVVLDRKPDLVISGINHGSNSSINVIYSGTMSAAVEGSLEGIPAIGFSLCDYSWEANFEKANTAILELCKRVLKEGLPKGVCLNVNIPKYNGNPYKGMKVCRQARANWEEEFDSRRDPRHRNYYWLTGKFVNYDHGEDTDEWALDNYYISVVPVNSDVTAHAMIQTLNEWDL
ncbi:MAG TPA: 5'/3'-nucleotidase SurE [Cryomorphaceae bacterium]|nr:5'/3'-nucleotidase SurE [Owenweeksia sp.]MBF97480.1 5'/3'-nucleotidase SurE [Owenweeksia sp.]HAD96449.1 5'/3'-nucleotidase SurE [Cryomorphaceae bacterium]HBF19746.1 5'/3'-nucleotidase SurE [Cryomorphaceae bacterium]|tara:strand:- start:20403 stop:21176 length:774 start_codon:yes stop_codon:yes gene_type:complete